MKLSGIQFTGSPAKIFSISVLKDKASSAFGRIANMGFWSLEKIDEAKNAGPEATTPSIKIFLDEDV